MNLDENIYATIDSYLNKQLSDAERIRFEKMMNANPALKQEVLMVELANEVVVDFSLEDVKNDLRLIHESGNKSNGWLPYFMGGVAALVLTLGAYYFLPDQKDIENSVPVVITDADSLNVISETLVETPEESLTPQPNVSASEAVNKQRITQDAATLETNKPNTPPLSEQIVIVEKQVEEKAVVSCEEVRISANLTIENTCEGEHNGKVILNKNTLQGGVKPYEFALISSKTSIKKKDIPFGEQNEYDSLSEGYYSVFIRDSNGCISYSPKAAYVNASSCEHLEDDVFYKVDERGHWKIHTDLTQDGTIQILDSLGNVHFGKSFQKGEEVYWDGVNNEGDYLKKGKYDFVIQYQNGHKVSAPIEIK